MTSVQNTTAARTVRSEARVAVRRLYFYGMTLISLIAGLIAVDSLLVALDSVWFGRAFAVGVDSYLRDRIAGAGGVILVATPLFLIHWGVIRSWREPDEKRSALRKFALYVASTLGVGYAIFLAYLLIEGITQLALGASPAQTDVWPSGWLRLVVMSAFGLGLQVYFQSVLHSDGDRGDEEGLAGTWRRLYFAAAGAAGLFLVIRGGGTLVESLLRMLLEPLAPSVAGEWWRFTLAGAVAQLLVGSVLLRRNWLNWMALTQAHPGEAQTALRRFYLYAAVVGGALATLIPLARMLNDVLLVAFGRLDLGDPAVLDTLTTMLAYTPIGLAVWVWHQRFLHREADAYGESEHGATVRRLYTYAVAATGLALFWVGILRVLEVVLDWSIRLARPALGDIWVEPLALGLSLLAVGAPLWAYHWRSAQVVARSDSAAGLEERASGPRKVYLYGAALAGALIVLFFLAQVVYRVLLFLLGDDARLFDFTAVGDVAQSVLAGIVWGVHVLALRGDARMGTEPPPAAPPSLDEHRAFLQARMLTLETELAELREELAALDAEAAQTANARTRDGGG